MPSGPDETSGRRPLPEVIERWFDALVDTSPTAMAVISTLENRYVRANPAMLEMFGMTLPELLHADPFSLGQRLTHPDDLYGEEELFAELAAGTRRSYRRVKRFVSVDGRLRWGLATLAAWYEPSTEPGALVGPMSWVSVHIVDMTREKALEETLARREEELRHAQKVDALGRLSAGVAHDFNNLLTVIMGHAQALKDGLDRGHGVLSGPDVEVDLDAVLAASERAAALTVQLLAHGRREPSAPRAFVLSELAASSGRLLSRTLGSDIEVEHDFDAKGAVFADQGQIGQVVMNLMLNARDALGKGGKIRLATRDVVIPDAPSPEGPLGPGPGEWVALVVTDTGHGMAPEVQARIFEPFFTTRAERPGLQGTGLGLSTVHRIVTDARGHVSVESAEGRGTTVTVYLPRAAPPSAVISRVVPARQAAPPSTRRILVVEDEPSVRSLVATVLMGAHYLVSVARDGEEGIRIFQAAQEPFHLVVTDLVMPHVGGLDLAKELQLHLHGDAPRMLFLSGYSTHRPAELAPYGNLLPKPFTPAELLAAVAEALEASPAPAKIQMRS